jgi:predicted ATP-binding protein involved in virulence
MELKDLHEEVFKFLLDKRKADPSLRYRLRGRGQSTTEKKDNGFWFLEANSTAFYTSFWEAYPDGNNFAFPIIRFIINAEGKCVLHIRRPKPQHISLWNSIAPSLYLKVKKTDEEWEKEYEGNDVEKNLEYFLSAERPYLNSFFKLRGVEADYPPFNEAEFLTKFDDIQKLREKLAREKDALMFADFIERKQKKLFVETLQLTNINAFKSLNISFDKQVTSFVGGNGSGKTTILRAIALGLVGVDGLKNPPKLLAIDEAQKDIVKYKKEGSVDVFYQYENEPTQDFGVVYKSLDNGKASSEAQNSKKEGGLFVKDKSALKTLVVGFAQQGDAETKISERESPNMDDLEALVVNNPDNRFEEFAKWFRIGLNKPDSKDFRVLISKIISIINACIRKNEEGDAANDIDFVGTTEIYLKTRNNPKGIPIDKLSQGYRNLLAWVGFFAKRMHEYHLTLIEEGVLPESVNFMDLPAVCLIDEIDTYLHPDWQYSILKGLVESFPNVQFFITSHSPLVLTSVPSDKMTIYELESSSDGSVDAYLMDKNLYGADANRSTREISSERLPYIETAFAEINTHIENGEFDEAERILNGLEIDKTDIAFVMAKRKIQVKRLSSKN